MKNELLFVFRYRPGRTMEITGWGKVLEVGGSTKRSLSSPVTLQEATVPIISPKSCQDDSVCIMKFIVICTRFRALFCINRVSIMFEITEWFVYNRYMVRGELVTKCFVLVTLSTGDLIHVTEIRVVQQLLSLKIGIH